MTLQKIKESDFNAVRMLYTIDLYDRGVGFVAETKTFRLSQAGPTEKDAIERLKSMMDAHVHYNIYKKTILENFSIYNVSFELRGKTLIVSEIAPDNKVDVENNVSKAVSK